MGEMRNPGVTRQHKHSFWGSSITKKISLRIVNIDQAKDKGEVYNNTLETQGQATKLKEQISRQKSTSKMPR